MKIDAYVAVPKGDTRTIKAILTDSLGAPFDLTGYEVIFTAKLGMSDTDANAVIGPKAGSVQDAEGGILHVDLLSNDTNITPNDYHFDIRIYKETTNIYTIVRGKLNILENITDNVIQEL
jgi:hypothetical protein